MAGKEFVPLGDTVQILGAYLVGKNTHFSPYFSLPWGITDLP